MAKPNGDMNPQPLENKVALVTGAARGIGYGIARRFAHEGANVVLADVSGALADDSARCIAAETGRPALGLTCDVTDRAAVDAAFARTETDFGGVDIVVANAGVCPFVPFLDLSPETWQRTLDVILTGSFHTAQAAARRMIAQGSERGGRIIFITSLATVQAAGNQADYAAAKSGVKMLMASIAPGLGKHNIRVNAIAPGVIHTEMGAPHWDVPENRAEFARTNPAGRLGEPADIAAAAVFLASRDAEYIIGTTLRVDGGALPIG